MIAQILRIFARGQRATVQNHFHAVNANRVHYAHATVIRLIFNAPKNNVQDNHTAVFASCKANFTTFRICSFRVILVFEDFLFLEISFLCHSFQYSHSIQQQSQPLTNPFPYQFYALRTCVQGSSFPPKPPTQHFRP